MASFKVTIALVLIILAALTTIEGMSLRRVRSLGGELRCRCINTESKRIGRFIAKYEITRPNSHCEETEIIATLKTGQKVCLNPQALWVQAMIIRIVKPS